MVSTATAIATAIDANETEHLQKQQTNKQTN